MCATTSAAHRGGMLPPTTALMLLKTHAAEVERATARRGRLRRGQRRFRRHSRVRKAFA